MKKMIVLFSIFFGFFWLFGMEKKSKAKQDKLSPVPSIVINHHFTSSIPTSGSGSGKTPIKSHKELTEQVQQAFRPSGSFENKVVENKSK